MSNLMREEFESAMSLETGLSIELFELDRNGDSYLSTGPKYAWWAWQASRECLVIDLPKPAGLDRMSSEISMQEIREDNRFNRALELAKKALTAAGVKYK